MLAVGGGSLFIAFRLETAAKSRVAKLGFAAAVTGKNRFNAICDTVSKEKSAYEYSYHIEKERQLCFSSTHKLP